MQKYNEFMAVYRVYVLIRALDIEYAEGIPDDMMIEDAFRAEHARTLNVAMRAFAYALDAIVDAIECPRLQHRAKTRLQVAVNVGYHVAGVEKPYYSDPESRARSEFGWKVAEAFKSDLSYAEQLGEEFRGLMANGICPELRRSETIAMNRICR